MTWPLFGLSLGILLTGPGLAAAAAPALPSGGKVVSGTAAIGAPSAGALTINQSSSQAIINWNSFSIGAGGQVQINNGTGATLNRVTGGSVSSISGLLSATGSVYLINPNGVIIGSSGVVKVGGTFVASTQDVTNANFLAGGDLTFSGASTASVINLGKVGALGGDVALIAAKVSNTGAVTAANGTVGLISGYSVLMRDAALDDGRFSVLVGGADTSVVNAGLVQAANAELRAEQGNVYALAGNTAGVIRATGVKAGDGHVWLVADQGRLSLAGTIEAQGPDGAPGAVETSGQTADIGAVSINAHGGTWLVDPDDLTINSTAAASIDNALNQGTSVVEQTTATGATGAGAVNTAGSGDIIVAAPLSWSTNASLTLSAYRNVALAANATITSTGGGAVTLHADNTGTGTGAVTFASGAHVSTSGGVSIFYNPASNPAGVAVNSTSYTSPTAYAADVTGGAALNAYMLVNTVYDLQNMENNLSGVYALGRSIDATVTASWNLGAGFKPLGTTSSPFLGVLNGENDTISGLTINLPGADGLGLFRSLAGSVSNLGLSSATITGAGATGAIAGYLSGSISNAWVTGSVTGGSNDVGGLVGTSNSGTISFSTFSGSVSNPGRVATGGIVGWNAGAVHDVSTSGTITSGVYVGGVIGYNQVGSVDFDLASDAQVVASQYSGGVVGWNRGSISNAYFSGVIGQQGATTIGGIAGLDSDGTVSSVYSSGKVIGTGGALVGAGSVVDGYWDAGTSGQTAAVGSASSASQDVVAIGGSTGLSPYAQSTYAAFNFGASGPWVIIAGSTRPMLKSEYATTITDSHQLQLMALDPTATYTLAGGIDASGTGLLSDVWSSAGFVPVGTDDKAFSGAFNGGGFTISGLTINRPSTSFVGLFGITGAQTTLSNVNLTAENIVGGASVGGLVGYSYGVVSNATSSGSVSGAYAVGGLVGFNPGSVSTSSSSAAVSGSGSFTGGLVGYNSGTLTSDSASGNVAATSDFSGGLLGYNAGALASVSASGNVNGTQFVGGLVGWNNASFTGGAATGAVSGAYAVGGLAGWSAAAISNATASGAVTDTGAFAGGLVGFNAAALSGDSAHGQVNGQAYAGGLVGYNIAGITNASASGGVSGSYATGGAVGLNNANGVLTQVSASGAVTSADYGGGLVGWNDGLVQEGQAVTSLPVSGGSTYTVTALLPSTASGNVGGQGAFLGGFVGYNDGTIIGASATGNVTGQQAYVGGFAGFNAGTLSSASVARLGACSGSTCTADSSSGVLVAAVSAAGKVSGVYFTGGLVGYNAGQITGASSTAAVAGPAFTGGLVGWNANTITASSASGAVTGAGPFTGGLVGYNGAGIATSQASGAVSSSGDYAGGLVGYTTAALSGDSARGAVSGGAFVGGLAGYSSAPVQDSYATGAVAGVYAVGGLVGWNDGAITAAYATGAVSNPSGNFAGGLVGYNSGQLSAAYAAGAVSGSQFAGGVVGYGTPSSALANVYWDIGSTGQATAGAPFGAIANLTGIGGASGLSAYAQSTYQGFDFASVWSIQPSSSRPYLKGAPQTPPPA